MQSDEGAPAHAGGLGPVRGDAGDPLTGRLLDGRYEIGARIARGGMASVYEATDLRLDRMVAVKVMHPGLGDDADFAARFVREARAAARISHPNVVAVYDQGNDDGVVFLVMEHVRGRTLRDLIRAEAPMPPARALALLEPVLGALAAAHREGLIHRDVKPENVLIANDGRIKVADFGLAKAVNADTQHTATGGVLIGTVSYLAPELVVEGRADPRADVYAAGVVLYELLTGVKPHEGESPIQVAYKHVHSDVPPPSELVPGIPDYVDALVARATARDQSQRPPDAGVMLHQLHRVAQALADGVVADPDLTADLALPASAGVAAGLLEAAADRDGLPEIVEPDEPVLDQPYDAGAGDGQETPAGDDWEQMWQQLEEEPQEYPAEELTTALEHTAERVVQPVVDVPHEPTTTLHSPTYPPAPPAVTDEEAAPGPPRRSRRGLVLLVLALLVAVLVGVGAWWFGWGRYTSTPSVIGLGEKEAVAKIEAAGLVADTSDPAYSEEVPEGEVISTDPDAGTRILDGGTVSVVVSLGKERYRVPDVLGLTEDRAQQRIAQRHLAYGTSTQRWSETVPEGRVIATTPKAGKRVKPDTVVDLVVSKGRKPIRVADWTGKDADQATQALEAKGLVVDSSEEYSDTVASGDVISQTPSSGTLYRGDTVTLVVSRGPELVEVPRAGVIAAGVDDARQTLEDLGFKVRVREDEAYLGLGFVRRTDPPAGTMVPKGSTITLYLI